MTTLRIEVARHSSTRIEDIVEGLRLCGVMKHLEIEAPHGYDFLDADQRAELIHELGCNLICVTELPPEPEPVIPWHRRLWWFLTRPFRKPITAHDFLAKMYGDDVGIAKLTNRSSPFLDMPERKSK